MQTQPEEIDADNRTRANFAMEEYKALNAELLQRLTISIQILAASIGAIVALVAFTAGGNLTFWVGASLVVFVVLVVAIIMRMVDSDIRYAAIRLIEIEEFVNRVTRGDDKFPLSWQRRFGILSRGYFDRFRRFNHSPR